MTDAHTPRQDSNRANSQPYRKNSHCSTCGHPFAPDQPWPRHCTNCANISFLNPLPVVIVLLPVDEGVLAVRRDQEPGRGMLALPGGFIELGESWQEAGARELNEEAGAIVDPETIREFRVFSAPDDTIVICGRAPAQLRSELRPFQPTDEVSERRILNRPAELAFPLHTEIVTTFFSARYAAGAP